MIERDNPRISIARQCDLVGISRSSFYYEPARESEENLLYMRLMDAEYLERPYKGVGQMTSFLRRQGCGVNTKRIRRLYKQLGLRAICPGPHTSKPSKGAEHQVFPYLLRDLKIERPGQVIGTDFTYLPMDGGFMYLSAFIDWYSRYVLSWELSNSMDVDFCLQSLSRIWSQTEVDIVNTDQGSQYTSRLFVNAVKEGGARHSMDGKGRAIDNVFTERLWRTVKYEEVYLKSYKDGIEAWRELKSYFHYYNNERSHSSLGEKTPAEVFFGQK